VLDIIVVGGGPGGSTAATFLAQKGFSVLLLERERFPRFQIGESLLPFNNDLLDRLGITDQLAAGDFTPKYGAEFITGDGKLNTVFRFDLNLEPKYQRTFQVTRSEFDTVLLRNAAKHGVDVREACGVASVDLRDPQLAIVTTTSGERFESRFVVDASGHSALLGNRAKSDIAELRSVAVFSQWRGVERFPGKRGGNTIVVVLRDAWFWLIPITSEIMSVGLVADREHVKACGLRPEQLLERTIAETPWLAERMRDAVRVDDVRTRKDFSYAIDHIAGENFAMVGDAAGFLDPIFSTGVYMAMKGAGIAADAIEQKLRRGSMRGLQRYEREFQRAFRRYLRFVSNFYTRPFLEVFLHPSPRFGLERAIVHVLGGNVYGAHTNRFRLALFFWLVRLQRRFGTIAPRIDWDALPSPASV
jgi:flavin-dependent dehydrogenase